MPTVEQRVAALEAYLGTSSPGPNLGLPMMRALNTIVPRIVDATTRGAFPGFGSGQTDTYTASDNVDGTHPLNIRYVIPQNFQRLTAARLSFHLGAYRTYSNFTATGTSTESANHNHSHNHGAHSHSHAHSQVITATGSVGPTMWTDSAAGAIKDSGLVSNATISNINGDATGTTPSTDSVGQSASHTHTVSGSTFSGVVEGATAAGVTIAFDGVDQTTALGGPWSVDVIEVDVRAFIAIVSGAYHTIALQPNGLGRIEAHMRLSSYVDSRGIT